MHKSFWHCQELTQLVGGLLKLTNTLAHMLESLHERAPNVQAKASVLASTWLLGAHTIGVWVV